MSSATSQLDFRVRFSQSFSLGIILSNIKDWFIP